MMDTQITDAPENDLDLMTLYDEIGEFNEGLAPVRRNGEMFHIQTDAIPAYNNRFDWVGVFCNGRAPAEKNKERFHIDKFGKRLEDT